MRPGGSGSSPPRLDLRERQLPWASFSIPIAAARHKGPPARWRDSVAGVACSRDASGSIGRPGRRVVIAVTLAAGRPGVGGGDRRAGPGGRAKRASAAAGSKHGGIGAGFPGLRSPSRLPARPMIRPRRRFPRRARASAQRQFPRIFRFGRVSGRVATSCSQCPRRGRRSGSVTPPAAGRYGTCSTGRGGIGGGGARGIGHDGGGRARRRRDVFRSCTAAIVCTRCPPPPRR